MSYMRSFDTKVLALRFFNVFGPYQRLVTRTPAVIPAFIAAALEGKALTVHGDGTQTRDFTYVGDVMAVITDALRREVTTDSPVNLAFSSNTSLLALIAELEALLDRPLELEHAPSRGGDVHDSQADCSRLQALFPSIRPTPLADGLRSTVEWFYGLEGDTASAAVAARR